MLLMKALKKTGIPVLNCKAHARRKFIDAAQNYPERAEEARLRFQKLYEVERIIRRWNFPPEDALELR